MSLTLITYLSYLSVSIALTFWVGRTLARSGRHYLTERLGNRAKLADSLNRLLLMGFYLLNIGYISLTMYSGMTIASVEHMVEVLSYKLGIILIVLAVLHFVNLLILFRVRRRVELEPA